MAMNKLINLTLLGVFQQSTKKYIDDQDLKSIKNIKYENYKLNFYKTEDASGTAAYSIDLPEEMFLDQTKTEFVNSFTWSIEKYPNTTNPSLDGKPVLVLAVKGQTSSINYSFVSLEDLIDIYIGENTQSANTTITGNKVSVNVNISKTSDNQLQIKTDGLYIAPTSGEVELTYATEQEVKDLWN